jgi:hypothetical protein
MNTYELQATCTCPADGKGDVYSITIRSRRMLWTNEIGQCAERLASLRIPQEEFTLRMARELGAEVTTVGQHPAFVDESKPVVSPVTLTCVYGKC